jgi:hypothetical protein
MMHQTRNKAVNILNTSITKRVIIANVILQSSIIASKGLSTMLVCSSMRVRIDTRWQMENHVRMESRPPIRNGTDWKIFRISTSWILYHPNYYKLLSFSNKMKVHVHNTNQTIKPVNYSTKSASTIFLLRTMYKV